MFLVVTFASIYVSLALGYFVKNTISHRRYWKDFIEKKAAAEQASENIVESMRDDVAKAIPPMDRTKVAQ
ncbi:MAG: hypothetical protein EOP45_11670 [Sphingobacteriaceae bacterium]|nr:MAG: hypothetical protein EOP45_11670 [Sphingobacteriaceae bacterium]